MIKQKPIYIQQAEEMMLKLGFDPKTGKALSKSKGKAMSESKGHPLINSPRSNPYSHPTPPFKIKSLDKTMRQSARGYTYESSALYRNAVVLQLLTKVFTRSLDPIKYSRLITQMDSSARSVVANIREGYVRPTSSSYSEFLGFSQGSLEELRGDFIDCKDDGLLKSIPGSNLASLKISLKPSPNVSPRQHLETLKRIILGEDKRSLRGIRSEQLTYEIFMELVNKTSYLFKKAVTGLDNKIIRDEKRKLSEDLNAHWRKYW